MFDFSSTMVPHKSYIGISDGPPLQTLFKTACVSPNWMDAINREYNALIPRGTWKYIHSDPKYPLVRLKWKFRAKELNGSGEQFLYRRVLRGEFQTEWLEFDPLDLYAPVSSHEVIRMFLSVPASKDLEEEVWDISNTYLFGDLDIPIRMSDHTNYSQQVAFPGYDCL